MDIEVLKNNISAHGCYCMRSMKKSDGYKQKIKWTEETKKKLFKFVLIFRQNNCNNLNGNPQSVYINSSPCASICTFESFDGLIQNSVLFRL